MSYSLSLAVSPLLCRFLGNSERLLKWSGRRKKKLRNLNSEGYTDHPVSALQSYAAWGKVVDLGGLKKRSLAKDGAVANAESTESDSEEDEEGSEEEEKDESESEEGNGESLSRDISIKKTTAPRYQPDKVIVGSGSIRPIPSFMSDLKAADGVTARQPSIVRDLWSQVNHCQADV